MPGIFGLALKTDDGAVSGISESRGHRQLDAMAAAMRYDPSYVCHRFESSSLGVFAAWVGRGDEAMFDGPVEVEELGITLFLTGEPSCETAAFGGKTREPVGDSSEGMRIVGAYELSREEFPSRVRGLFAGFLISERSQESLLFNDRLGIERLFIYEDDRALYFSSEAKAILAVVPETRSFDSNGVAEFMACGCTLGETSLFRGIRVLPAATVVRLRKGTRPRYRKYFDRTAWEDLEPLSERDFLTMLGTTLERKLELQTMQHRHAAVSLTGGVDSRIIMACVRAPRRGLPCYTFGSMYRDTYDVWVAKQVAAVCDQPHEVLVLGEEFIGRLREYLEKGVLISDGYLGLSGAAELYLNGSARRIAPIRITGNYGGELLRGARAFKGSMPKGDFLVPELAERVRGAMDTFSRLTEMRDISFTLFSQAPSGYGRYAIERSQLMMRSPFLDEDIIQLLYRSPRRAVSRSDLSSRLIGQRRPDLAAIPTDRGTLGGGGRLARNARRIYRGALFKAEYWTGHGTPCWMAVLTSRMPGLLIERAFRGRHKFLHPRAWFLRELGEYTRQILADHQTLLAGYFNSQRVAAMVKSDQAGGTNYSQELDRVLTLALGSRLLFRA
jgi:asparagine synthase (glutamine-hydrolysing)